MIVWTLIKKYKKPTADYEKQILLWSIGFIFLFSVVMVCYLKFIYIDKSDEEIIKLLNSSQVEKVQGFISNFTRKVEHKKYGSVTTEDFNVDTIAFTYTDALLGRFNSFSKTYNGIFHNGLPVRITYIKGDNRYAENDNWILKIEIAK